VTPVFVRKFPKADEFRTFVVNVPFRKAQEDEFRHIVPVVAGLLFLSMLAERLFEVLLLHFVKYQRGGGSKFEGNNWKGIVSLEQGQLFLYSSLCFSAGWCSFRYSLSI
jgi:hypothetical protein